MLTQKPITNKIYSVSFTSKNNMTMYESEYSLAYNG